MLRARRQPASSAFSKETQEVPGVNTGPGPTSTHAVSREWRRLLHMAPALAVGQPIRMPVRMPMCMPIGMAICMAVGMAPGVIGPGAEGADGKRHSRSVAGRNAA